MTTYDPLTLRQPRNDKCDKCWGWECLPERLRWFRGGVIHKSMRDEVSKKHDE